jgi:hypothetical protein
MWGKNIPTSKNEVLLNKKKSRLGAALQTADEPHSFGGVCFLEIASECLRLFVGICGDSLIPVKLIDVGR